MSPRPVSLLRRTGLVAVTIVGLLSCSSRASAETISLFYDKAANSSDSARVPLSFTGGSSTVRVTPGPYYWHQATPLNSNFPANIATFCVELSQGFPSGSATFTVDSLGAKVSASKATAITKLWGSHYDTDWESSSFTGSTQSTAFQIALWELIYDGPSGSLTNGTFRYTGPVSDSAAALAASWLTALSSTPTSVFASNFGTSQLVWLSNGSKQDQLMIVHSPEPPKVVPAPPSVLLAGFALGTGLLGRLIRRRKEVAAAVN